MAGGTDHIDAAQDTLNEHPADRPDKARDLIEARIASVENADQLKADERIKTTADFLVKYGKELNGLMSSLEKGEQSGISKILRHVAANLEQEIQTAHEQMEQELAEVESAEEKSANKDAFMKALVDIRSSMDPNNELNERAIKQISKITSTLSDTAKRKVEAILEQELNLEEGVLNKERFAAVKEIIADESTESDRGLAEDSAEETLMRELGVDNEETLQEKLEGLKEPEFKNILLKMGSRFSDDAREKLAKLLYKKGMKPQTANQVRFDAMERIVVEELGEEKILALQDRLNNVDEGEFAEIVKKHLALGEVQPANNTAPVEVEVEDVVDEVEEEPQETAVRLEGLLNEMKQDMESGLTARQKSQIDDLARTLLKQMEEGRAKEMTAEQIVGIAKAKITA